MLGSLVMPTRNLHEFILCAIGAYVVTRITFPPNEPPPTFPFLFGFNDNKDE